MPLVKYELFVILSVVGSLVNFTNCIYVPGEQSSNPPCKTTIWRKPALQPDNANVIMHHNYSKVYVHSKIPQLEQIYSPIQQKTITETKPFIYEHPIEPQFNLNQDNTNSRQWHHTQSNYRDQRVLSQNPNTNYGTPPPVQQLETKNIDQQFWTDKQTSSSQTVNTYQKFDSHSGTPTTNIGIHDKLEQFEPYEYQRRDSTNRENYNIDSGVSHLPPLRKEFEVFGFQYPPRAEELHPFREQPKPFSNMAFEQCPKNVTGQLVYLWSCSQFLNCWKGRGFIQNCAPGTLFNPKTMECDFPHKVNCISGTHNQQVLQERYIQSDHSNKVLCKPNFTGLLPYTSDCTKFINCANGQTFIQDCGPGTAFNPTIQACDHSKNTNCQIPSNTASYTRQNQNYLQQGFDSQPKIHCNEKHCQTPPNNLPTLKDVQKSHQQNQNRHIFTTSQNVNTNQYGQQPIPNQQNINCGNNCQSTVQNKQPIPNQQNINCGNNCQSTVQNKQPNYHQQNAQNPNYHQQNVQNPNYHQQNVQNPNYHQQNVQNPNYPQQNVQNPNYPQQNVQNPNYSKNCQQQPTQGNPPNIDPNCIRISSTPSTHNITPQSSSNTQTTYQLIQNCNQNCQQQIYSCNQNCQRQHVYCFNNCPKNTDCSNICLPLSQNCSGNCQTINEGCLNNCQKLGSIPPNNQQIHTGGIATASQPFSPPSGPPTASSTGQNFIVNTGQQAGQQFCNQNCQRQHYNCSNICQRSKQNCVVDCQKFNHNCNQICQEPLESCSKNCQSVRENCIQNCHKPILVGNQHVHTGVIPNVPQHHSVSGRAPSSTQHTSQDTSSKGHFIINTGQTSNYGQQTQSILSPYSDRNIPSHTVRQDLITAGTQNIGLINQGSRTDRGSQVNQPQVKCPTGHTGLAPHPYICAKFLNCANGRTFVQDCGPGTVFNPNLKVCDWPHNVKCVTNSGNNSPKGTTTSDYPPPYLGQPYGQIQATSNTQRQDNFEAPNPTQIHPNINVQNQHFQPTNVQNQNVPLHGQDNPTYIAGTPSQNKQETLVTSQTQNTGQSNHNIRPIYTQSRPPYQHPGNSTHKESNIYYINPINIAESTTPTYVGAASSVVHKTVSYSSSKQTGEYNNQDQSRINNIPLTHGKILTTSVNVHSNPNRKGIVHWPTPYPTGNYEANTNVGSNFTEKSVQNCRNDEFQCFIGSCIAKLWVCDGEKDCFNGLDEQNCTAPTSLFTTFPNSRLEQHNIETWFQTPLEECARKCINSNHFICRSFSFRAKDTTCILSDSNIGLCGALVQDDEFSYHELNSTSVSCKNMYECSNHKCINFTQVCDGQDDCGNRMDEKLCSAESLGYEIKLAGSHNKNEGRIEIKVFEEWGYICDDQFDLKDAEIACKELGFPLGVVEVKSASYFALSIRDNETFYLMDNVACTGNETSLRDCDFNGWGVHNCMPQEIVGVVCATAEDVCPKDHWLCDTSKECVHIRYVCDGFSDCSDHSDEGSQHCEAPVEIRLANGTSKNEGRVEIRYHGIWGTICDDDFTDLAAKVICQTVGYYGSAVVKKNGAFGAGLGPIWLDQVHCLGNESSIEDCSHWSWSEHNCEHSEDVGVFCSEIDASQYEKKSKDKDIIQMNPISPETVDSNFPIKCGYRSFDLFTDENNENSDIHFRVVKGSIASKGDYPWQATIRVKGGPHSSHWCGAVVLSNKYILTAAHCLVGFPKGSYIVRAGDYNIDELEGTEEEAYIEDYYVHEKFRQGGQMNNDIALIRLKGAGLHLSKHVQPICLPEKTANYRQGLNCTISGFGSTGTGSSTSSRLLRSGWVSLQSESICKKPQVYGTSITDGMFCAGSLDEGVDSCDGDSGGPLACLDNGLFTLYGLTSWGQRCGLANKPGVYVKIAYYRDWINEKMQESS